MATARKYIAGHDSGALTQAAFTIDEFCQAHRICRAQFYILLNAGRGPRVMKPNGPKGATRISVEAAAEWRRRMEGATDAPAA